MRYHKLAVKYVGRYPKFLLLFITFVLAYIIFDGRGYPPFNDFLLSTGYFGTFLAGAMFAYGFTAAPATAILLILAQEQDMILAGFIAGFGALMGDLLIFRFVRHSMSDEIRRFSREKISVYIDRKTPDLFKKYLVPVLAGFIIASPLPDEIGVSLLAASNTISLKIFSLISYMLNTIGIFGIFYIGRIIG